MSIPPSSLGGGRVNVRRLDELEKTLASMRKSLGGQPSAAPPIQETFGTTGNFGHPLDMLARTAANTTSPDDRFSTPGGGGSAFNGITPPAVTMQRPMQRVIPSETVPTTWSTELSGIDPVERGWLDIDDAKMLFERYPPPYSPSHTERHICVAWVHTWTGVDGRFWKHMLPSMPIISFGPQGAQFEQVRRQEPTLFLSMISAAASTLTIPDMFEKLQKEAVSIITYNAVVEGQKTAELLLSLLVLTFWPMAPSRYVPTLLPEIWTLGNIGDRFDQLKTYLHCHMCVGMAIDLSLQRSSKDGKNLSSRLFADEVELCNRKENFIRSLEKERTWLAVFIAAVGYQPP